MSWSQTQPLLRSSSILPISNDEIVSRDMRAAADALGVQLHILRANGERGFDGVFGALAQLRADALECLACLKGLRRLAFDLQ